MTGRLRVTITGPRVLLLLLLWCALVGTGGDRLATELVRRQRAAFALPPHPLGAARPAGRRCQEVGPWAAPRAERGRILLGRWESRSSPRCLVLRALEQSDTLHLDATVRARE